MSRWTDIATWIGPSPNRTTGGMKADVRGVVIHIAAGSYDGTIAWQRNPTADVSSHFIVARDGRIAQMVDTADASWAQRSGNSTWLSIENEGRLPGGVGYKPGLERLTDAQVEANARILAKAHQVYGSKVPLQLATSPSGRGLGHHSMGAEAGADWGHSACPGAVMKSQKPATLARAVQLASGAPASVSIGADDMGNTWTEPLTQGSPGFAGQQRDTALAFAWQSAYTANEGVQLLLAAATADEVRDRATLAAIQAITSNGGPDAAPIVQAIRDATAETHGYITQLQADLAAERKEAERLRQALAEALQP